MAQLIAVDGSNRYLVEDFLKDGGESLLHFRYFKNRPLDVLDHHLVTLLLIDAGRPVCYGHLDKEGEKVWLGIAALETEIGKGWGKRMMEELIDKARQARLEKIFLSVDHDNLRAKALYKRCGFKPVEQHERFAVYELVPSLDMVVSTVAFMGKPLSEMIAIGERENLKLEFSSGIRYEPCVEEMFLKAPVRRMLHNYFPPPAEPFVLNLASAREEIRNRSIQHCRQGLQLSAAVGAPFFSAHAGFCIDPDPSELGRRLRRSAFIEREKHWKLFVDALMEVLSEADRLGLFFLIENNVLAPMNQYDDNTNPLLCADDEEMLRLIREIDHPRLGLLIDTGHLKVSARTLGFSVQKALKTLAPYIHAFHHSDNDGTADLNNPIGEDYWFLRDCALFRSAVHVLEVKNQTIGGLKKQMDLLQSASIQPS